jgi:hypothetical protein
LDKVEAIYEPSALTGALRQGEIVSDVIQVRLMIESLVPGAEPAIAEVRHPLAIIMTQDCDLDWDFKARQSNGSEGKRIPNVLFCEVIGATELRGRQGINSEIWKRISQNKDERYQFLQRILPDADAVGKGLPELGIDFKRYFTVPTEELYHRLIAQAHRRCRLLSPYLEHLSTRFGYYQFRVALPADHLSE